MPITMPVAKDVRPAYDYAPAIPGVAFGNIAGPGPLAVKNVSRSDGMPTFESCAGANNGSYIGFGIIGQNAVAGGGPLGIAALRRTVIAGFVGATPGAPVYLDATNGTLTHTATSNGPQIGIALTANLIYFN